VAANPPFVPWADRAHRSCGLLVREAAGPPAPSRAETGIARRGHEGVASWRGRAPSGRDGCQRAASELPPPASDRLPCMSPTGRRPACGEVSGCPGSPTAIDWKSLATMNGVARPVTNAVVALDSWPEAPSAAVSPAPANSRSVMATSITGRSAGLLQGHRQRRRGPVGRMDAERVSASATPLPSSPQSAACKPVTTQMVAKRGAFIALSGQLAPLGARFRAAPRGERRGEGGVGGAADLFSTR
jgi:hypothetical protein